jgi:hypothetical protein
MSIAECNNNQYSIGEYTKILGALGSESTYFMNSSTRKLASTNLIAGYAIFPAAML